MYTEIHCANRAEWLEQRRQGLVLGRDVVPDLNAVCPERTGDHKLLAAGVRILDREQLGRKLPAELPVHPADKLHRRHR